VKHAIAITSLILSSCGDSGHKPDPDTLLRCWKVTHVRQDSHSSTPLYDVEFQGIIIPGTEGGSLARSDTCRDVRLHFTQMSPGAARIFHRIGSTASNRDIVGAGIEGIATLSLLDTSDKYHIRSKVVGLVRYRVMTETETNRFISRFNIG